MYANLHQRWCHYSSSWIWTLCVSRRSKGWRAHLIAPALRLQVLLSSLAHRTACQIWTCNMWHQFCRQHPLWRLARQQKNILQTHSTRFHSGMDLCLNSSGGLLCQALSLGIGEKVCTSIGRDLAFLRERQWPMQALGSRLAAYIILSVLFCRYLLHLPGHGYSVRLKYLLLCASTVVFYDNGMHEFWYHILEVFCPIWSAAT